MAISCRRHAAALCRLALCAFVLTPLFSTPALGASRPAATPKLTLADAKDGNAFIPPAKPAQPAEALFYPDEVQVTVEEKLTPRPLPDGSLGFALALPSGADRSTFFVSVDGVSAAGTSWYGDEESPMRPLLRQGRIALPPSRHTLVPEDEPVPERRELLRLRADLLTEATRLQGGIDSANARLTVWMAPASADKPFSPEERQKLDASLEKLLPALYSARDKDQRSLQDVQARLRKAEEALAEFDRANDVLVALVPFADTGADNDPAKGVQVTTTLRYGYMLPARCVTSYRVGAHPEGKRLSIEQDATLTQHSGIAWDNVDIAVSTVRRDRNLQPGQSRPWRIDLKSPPLKAAASRGSADMDMMEQAAPAPPAPMAAQVAVNQRADLRKAVKPAPTQQEMSTFRLWRLGSRRIAEGTPVRVPLSKDSYKADYFYTLRPMNSPQGFLTADLSLPAAVELPVGAAQFFVDGVAVGNGNFSFNGDKALVSFGSDPQITATVRDIKRGKGEQGFISKEQTLLWHWQITLKNTRKHPVEVRLEDPAPEALDDAVALTVTSSPKPEEITNPAQLGGAKIYRWKASLMPGEPFVVDHKVEVTAPADKVLSPGRAVR